MNRFFQRWLRPWVSTTDVSGLTIAPYAAYLLTANISIDASVGYSGMEIDQFRIEPGGA